MKSEKDTVELAARPETVNSKKDMAKPESTKDFSRRIVGESQEEAVDFCEAGREGLENAEKRADREGLAIDAGDKQELVGLEKEADEARNELLVSLEDGESKYKEMGVVSSAQEKKSEIRDFSKRYSSFRRSEMASQIWQMRQENKEKKKQAEEQNVQIAEQREKISGEMETIKARIERIEKVIVSFEQDIQQQKSGLWNKFMRVFKKGETDEEQLLEIARGKLNEQVEDLRKKTELLEEARDVILASTDLEDTKSELEKFYAEQSEIKSRFEEEREQRDLAKISREKGAIFVHGLPTDNYWLNNTSENNTLVDTKEVGAMEKIKMILGLEPTLSTSTINEASIYNKGMMYPFGIILKGGEVVSAYQGDAGTTTEHLYSRRSKYDKNIGNSSIQNNISERIKKAIDMPLEVGGGSDDGATGIGFNEIVVGNPKAAGLYINLDNPNKPVHMSTVEAISSETGLPVYGLKEGKILDLRNGGKEVALDEILESTANMSPQKRVKMAEDSIESFFAGVNGGRVPREAKKKMEELKKEALADESVSAENNPSQEINLLDAKGIKRKGNIATWTEKIFSKENVTNGNDLARIAQEQLKGEAPAEIERIFGGKTKDECLAIARKYMEEYSKLDNIYGKMKDKIIF